VIGVALQNRARHDQHHPAEQQEQPVAVRKIQVRMGSVLPLALPDVTLW
jgi:hypothetical protein